jgi:alpha-beta hydrolase superfamily lysophospholipase
MLFEMLHTPHILGTPVQVPVDGARLDGDLTLPPGASGTVLFAHGSGSSRHSPRNKFVAGVLHRHGVGTLLFDLLTPGEETADRVDGHLRFDINLLASRLLNVTLWFRQKQSRLSLGYFGSSTGAAAALAAETQSDVPIAAVVSRGGRPDLAQASLLRVKAPTLLIVGGEDTTVAAMNQQAYEQMRCPKALRIVPGATHLFEEHGALEQVAEMAAEWFARYLQPAAG